MFRDLRKPLPLPLPRPRPGHTLPIAGNQTSDTILKFLWDDRIDVVALARALQTPKDRAQVKGVSLFLLAQLLDPHRREDRELTKALPAVHSVLDQCDVITDGLPPVRASTAPVSQREGLWGGAEMHSKGRGPRARVGRSCSEGGGSWVPGRFSRLQMPLGGRRWGMRESARAAGLAHGTRALWRAWVPYGKGCGGGGMGHSPRVWAQQFHKRPLGGERHERTLFCPCRRKHKALAHEHPFGCLPAVISL